MHVVYIYLLFYFLQPTCKSLEEDFEDKDAIYESKRTEVVGRYSTIHVIFFSLSLSLPNLIIICVSMSVGTALKSQRANLEERIAEIERQLEKIHIPQVIYTKQHAGSKEERIDKDV